MNVILIVIAALALAGALALVIINRLKLKKTFDSLEKILNQAIEGTYTAGSFDETRLSRLETKLEEYLSSASISAQNVKNEKDKLKELISDISHHTLNLETIRIILNSESAQACMFCLLYFSSRFCWEKSFTV